MNLRSMAERIGDSQERIERSQGRVWAAKCSIESGLRTVATTIDRIYRTRQMIAKCDRDFSDYGGTLSR